MQRFTRDGAPSGKSGLQALRLSLQLIWVATDRYAKKRLLVVLALAAAAALLAALTPVALKRAIDGFTEVRAANFLEGPVLLVVVYVVGQYLMRCLAEWRLIAHVQAQGRLYRNVGLKLFEHVLRLPMRFHIHRRTGAIGQVAEQGIDGCEQLIQNIVFTILPVILEFVAIALVLLHFGYPVYLAILAVAAVAYLIVFERGAAGAQEPAHAMSAARIDAHAAMTDNLLNAEAIKYYDAERIVSISYDGSLARIESAWRRLARQRLGNGMWTATIFGLTLATSLMWAGYAVIGGTMTVGDFAMINSYIMRFVYPLELMGLAIREVIRALASLQALRELLMEDREPDTGSTAFNPSFEKGVVPGELTFERVTFSYDPNRVVLRDVSLHVPAGHTLALVGASGSGKSSVIRLLFRLYEPDSGRIVLDGVPISELSLSSLRQAIAVVPQDTVLFHDSIRSNIAFGRWGATDAEIEAAARIANLHDFISRQPDGYDTIVGERGLKLSGGERQRVAIARAALKRPRIFVFDEATSSLDSRTEREILKNLREVAGMSTTLVIAHRLSTIVHADVIAVLHEGIVRELGTHAELLARDAHYAALWRAQQGVRAHAGA
jgi:ABC-type transport system involved in Fe-S cluster assembly fused permease/ATPase subunit